jgi:serpin B
MKKTIAAAVALMLSATTATHAQTDAAREAAINANRFTLAMAREALKAQEDKNDNLVISPYNAMTNMALVGSGAEGATKKEFETALFGKDGAMDAGTTAFAGLNTALLDNAKGKVDLLTANGIWVNKALAKLSDSYAKMATENFKASMSAEDFGDKATVDKINTWAGDNTKGLITKIISQLQPSDAMVLASALYFKGKWTYPFDKSDTTDKKFAQDGGKEITVPMMKRQFADGDIRWQEKDGYQAVTMTYGAEGATPTRIVLLRPTDAKLSARDWLAQQETDAPAWLDLYGYENVAGTVELPRIELKQHHDLVPVLKALGITTAFTGSADFSKMVTEGSSPLFISAVTHDVVFKTDEEGSEAAAVTTTMMAGSAMPREPKRINIAFDRSFVFALQDTLTGAVFFLGAVNDPGTSK